MQPTRARILKIGDMDYCKTIYPDQTTLLWTGYRPKRSAARGVFDCTPGQFVRAMRDVHAGRFDLMVVYMSQRSPLHPRYWFRSLAQTPLKPYSSIARVYGVSWLRATRIPIPLIALDMNDQFGIGRNNFFLLDKADAVFKRELLADRWHVLYGSAHHSLPTMRVRRQPRWQERLAKIQPIALPAPVIDTGSLWSGDFPEKTSDVFFAGSTEANSWVRRTGIGELKELAARGVKVDMPSQRLPPDQFFQRMSRAWLAWSPSGFSWECYRTAEAAQCLSVPLVNHPVVERHRPLLHGEHLFQYDVEPGGLVRAVEAALADKPRLRRMAQAAREHVLAHHTLTALVDRVIETGLAIPAAPHGRSPA